MLLLSEIARLSDTVDADWRSPVADAVAAAWGFPPGAARYWRSSASHEAGWVHTGRHFVYDETRTGAVAHHPAGRHWSR